VFVTYPPYIREKARQMRVEKRLSVNEIAERLAISKATIYGWVLDIPLQRPRTNASRAAAESNRARAKALRDASYEAGVRSWPILSAEPSFRDFVTLFIAEGYKRTRHVVSVANSDPAVVAVCHRWLSKLSAREPCFSIQYHADQDLDELRAFWGERLGIDGARIAMQRKSNSNQLAGRTWRSEHGVLTVWVNDTLLRSRMQAWMDCLRASWT
jgi:hypothetical protein